MSFGVPGKHKIANRCKPESHVIVQRLPGLSTYQVQPKRGGPMRTLYQDHLLPIGQLTGENDSETIQPKKRIETRHQKHLRPFSVSASKDQKASTVARVLWEKFFVHYGLPSRINSDQGRDFQSRLIQEVLQLARVKKSHTSPYYPQGNPQPERFNRTLLNMLGTLVSKKKSTWSQ